MNIMENKTINKLLNIWGTILKVLFLALLSALLIFFCVTIWGNYSTSKQNEQENYSRLHNNYSESEIKGAVLLAYQKLENDLDFLDALDQQGTEDMDDSGIEAYEPFWKGASNKDASHTYYLLYIPVSNPYFFVYELRAGESEVSLIQVLAGSEIKDVTEPIEVKNLSDEETASCIRKCRSELADFEDLFDGKPTSIKDHTNQPIKDGANIRINYSDANITIENGDETFSFKPESNWSNEETDNSDEGQE